MLGAKVDINVDAEAGQKIQNGVEKYLFAGADRGFAEMTDKAPVDRGNLLKNMFSPEKEKERILHGVRDTSYARPMEFGTDPFYPPIKPLLEWSRRVSGGTGLGWYVARIKIPEEGIDAQPYARPARNKQISWYSSHSVREYIKDEL